MESYSSEVEMGSKWNDQIYIAEVLLHLHCGKQFERTKLHLADWIENSYESYAAV